MTLNFIKPITTINGADSDNKPLHFFDKGFLLGGGHEPQYQDVTIAGQMSLTLLNAKVDGLNYLKLYGGCEQSTGLPSGYTRIASFTSVSTSTTNLDTGIRYNANLKIECTVKDNGWGSYAGYFRLYSNESSKAFRLIYANSQNGKGWFTSGGSAAGTSSSANDLVSGTKYHIILDKDGLTTNNTYSPKTGAVAGDAPTNTTLLLCLTTSSSRQLTWYDRCTVWVGTNIVFNGLTAQRDSDSAVGFYDTISEEFFVATNCTAGSVSPSPELPQPIYCNNGEIKLKNFFDESTMVVEDCYIRAGSPTEQYPIGSEVRLAGVGDYNCSTFIPVEPSTQYTTIIPSFASISAGLCYYTGTTVDTVISGVPLYTQGSAIYTFTTPSNCNYIRFSWKNDKGNACKLYSKEVYTDGTVETVEDSLGNTATAQNLLAVDTIKDVQEVLTGEIIKNIRARVLDGTENWQLVGSGSTAYFYVAEYGTDALINSTTPACMCSHYRGCAPANAIGTIGIRVGTNIDNQTSRYYLYLRDTSFESADALKTFLAQQYTNGTPVIVIYPLATATTESATPQTLTTKQGSNTIEITQASISPLQLEANYKAGVEVTIQEVENANLDNSVTVTIG